MTKLITYAKGETSETIATDAVMSLWQFSRYKNNFGSNLFNEEALLPTGEKKAPVYRGKIKEAWDKLVEETPETVSKLTHLEAEAFRTFSRYLELAKSTGSKDPQLEKLERQLKEITDKSLPLMYEAYKILQPIVKDNEFLFS